MITRLYSDAKKVRELYLSCSDKSSFNWLRGRNVSDAFVICVGAGPWKFNRRRQIQRLALEKLEGRDISEISGDVNWYPLNWQNKFINSVKLNLKKDYAGSSFTDICEYFKHLDIANVNKHIYKLAGCPKGCKVLSLFCRDSLGVDSFPIDRHVERFLIKHSLPVDEDKLIKMCYLEGLDAARVAAAFVKEASKNSSAGRLENPDWSI